MPRMTQQQLDAYNLRRKQFRPDGAPRTSPLATDSRSLAEAAMAAVEPVPKENSAITCERDQHEQLMKWAHFNGIIYVHSRMDKATSQQVGEPDFYFMRRGKVVWVEMKFEHGKVSKSQLERQAALRHAGVGGETFWTIAEAIEFVSKNLLQSAEK